MALSGSPVDYIFAFFGGVLWSFTPCVYPLLPVIIGYIGVSACASRSRAFILSFSYASGTAFIYSLLGIMASLGGRAFGGIMSSLPVKIFSGAVILFLGLVMLDLVRLRVPVFRLARADKSRGSLLGAFFLGCSSALLISPCVTPVLGSILVFLASRKNIAYGATLLLSFAYGMGLVFVLAGTFSYIIIRLPRSGAWLEWIKRVCAFLLCGTGVYFIVKSILSAV